MDRTHTPALAWLLLAAALLGASGCSSVKRNNLHAVFAAMHRPKVEPTAESVARVTHPQLLLEYAGGSAVLVLGNDDDGRQAWYSHDRKIVYLDEHGVLVGSHGFATDAADIHGDDATTLASAAQRHEPATLSHRYDWMPGYRYGALVTGQLQVVGDESVDILGTPHALLHVREHLVGAGVKADNDYWLDPADGFVWKSRQLLAPGEMLAITQLKPYRPERVQ